MLDVQLLYEKYVQTGLATIDSRHVTVGSMFFSIRGHHFNGNQFAQDALDQGARYAVLDDPLYWRPGGQMILVDDVSTALQALAHYHRQRMGSRVPVIAITGSYGKTTTKDLLTLCLETTYKVVATKGNLNTRLGIALTLLEINPETEIGVVEMGADQIGDIAQASALACPTHGLVTAVGEVHLDGFGDLQGVIQGKKALYDYLYAHQGVAFVNTSDGLVMSMAQNFEHPITYPQKNDFLSLRFLPEDLPYLTIASDDKIVPTQLLGKCAFGNVSAALCMAKYFQVPLDRAYAQLKNYVPSNKRLELRTIATNQWLIDTYNASPASMQEAIDVLLELQVPTRIAILADMAELGMQSKKWHRQIVEKLCSSSLDLILLCGPLFSEAASDHVLSHLFCFDGKQKLYNYLSHAHFSHSGVLLKGGHSWHMDTLLHIFL